MFFRQEVNATKIQFSDYMSVKNYATLIEDFGKKLVNFVHVCVSRLQRACESCWPAGAMQLWFDHNAIVVTFARRIRDIPRRRWRWSPSRADGLHCSVPRCRRFAKSSWRRTLGPAQDSWSNLADQTRTRLLFAETPQYTTCLRRSSNLQNILRRTQGFS